MIAPSNDDRRDQLGSERGGTDGNGNSLQSHDTTWNYIRTQQVCRDYWQATYGPAAERTSRGGATWL